MLVMVTRAVRRWRTKWRIRSVVCHIDRVNQQSIQGGYGDQLGGFVRVLLQSPFCMSCMSSVILCGAQGAKRSAQCHHEGLTHVTPILFQPEVSHWQTCLWKPHAKKAPVSTEWDVFIRQVQSISGGASNGNCADQVESGDLVDDYDDTLGPCPWPDRNEMVIWCHIWYISPWAESPTSACTSPKFLGAQQNNTTSVDMRGTNERPPVINMGNRGQVSAIKS